MNSLAVCVGLWLAEGDSKSRYEITFTNNCKPLIALFHQELFSLFPNLNPRLYSYSRGGITNFSLEGVASRNYIDIRARKPYYVYRLASKKSVDKWKQIVDEFCFSEEFYEDIFKGFFAGEGNIKVSSHNSRVIRLAQKEPNEFIELIMDYLGLTYRFVSRDRNYWISGIWNWKIFAEKSLASVHWLKCARFRMAFSSYREEHYPDFFLRKSVFNLLVKPYSANKIAKLFKRSPARIYDVLKELKNNSLVDNYRVGSIDYWVRKDSNIIVLSVVKKYYLNLLETPRKISFLANYFSVSWKSAKKHLISLERHNLVVQDDSVWKSIKTNKQLVFL